MYEAIGGLFLRELCPYRRGIVGIDGLFEEQETQPLED